MDKPEILMYTMPTCGYCAKMKKELNEANVVYTERDFKQYNEEWQFIKSLTRSAVFPTFVVGNEYLIPNRDFSNPTEAIQSLQYYQNVKHRDQTLDDIVELLKNNMYMTKMALEKIDVIASKLQEAENKQKHIEELQKRRQEVIERNRKMAKDLQEKREGLKNYKKE
jgi:glutaredoxin